MKTRYIQCREAWLALAACLLGSGVSAMQPQPPVDLDRRYPAGSIATAALAEQALSDVAAVRQAVDARFQAESARCVHVFLANECQDKARRAHTLGQMQAHRVEVEAHDLQRKLAAQQRAQDRDAQHEQLHQQELQRPEKERQAQNAAQERVDRSKEHALDAQRQQAQAPANRERYEQRNAQHDKDETQRASVQLRNVAANERRYQNKQAQAKEYAATRAREREENRKAREERERKRKAEMGTTDAKDVPPVPDPQK
jgi:hypothetical protein